MSYQATRIVNNLAFRMKDYTNELQACVAKKLYYWGKRNVPRDEEGRTKDKRKIWGAPHHIAERGGVFLRGKKVIGPNFKGKMRAAKEGSIVMVYSNIKRTKKYPRFDYASAPNEAVGRPENIQTFLTHNLTKSEIIGMIEEGKKECSKKR